MPPPVVFFDIGETLGVPTAFAADGRLLGLRLYPWVTDVLAATSDAGIRLGLLSNTSEAETEANMADVLQTAGIYGYLDPSLLLYSGVTGHRKDSPLAFRRAAELAQEAEPEVECLFVGEDRVERGFAASAGLTPVPHPLLLETVLAGQSLHYLCVSLPIAGSTASAIGTLRQLPFLPAMVAREGAFLRIFGAGSSGSAGRLADNGFGVARLGPAGAPAVTSLYLLRDDLAVRSGYLSDKGSSEVLATRLGSDGVLEARPEGTLVALGSEDRADALHFIEAQHGHTSFLPLDPQLLAATEGEETGSFVGPASGFGFKSLSPSDVDAVSEIDSENVLAHIERYSGARPLHPGGDGRLIDSRHVDHEGNRLAVEQLVLDLGALMGAETVARHPFVHEGKRLENVEAVLLGDSEESVIVSAHLDSTSGFDPDTSNHATDPAPGADDDASGVAAVLEIARAMSRAYAVCGLNRTVRFVLFNAEEQGLVGSRAYARDLVASGVKIAAVLQLDMVGYRNVPDAVPHPYELHAGCPELPQVENRSIELAQLIASVSASVATALRSPQVYRSPDPAAGRSDHASFHLYGIPACVVSEDFFAGPQPDSPDPQGNPNYHQQEDVAVVSEYAADIARVVAASALVVARDSAPEEGNEHGA